MNSIMLDQNKDIVWSLLGVIYSNSLTISQKCILLYREIETYNLFLCACSEGYSLFATVASFGIENGGH